MSSASTPTPTPRPMEMIDGLLSHPLIIEVFLPIALVVFIMICKIYLNRKPDKQTKAIAWIELPIDLISLSLTIIVSLAIGKLLSALSSLVLFVIMIIPTILVVVFTRDNVEHYTNAVSGSNSGAKFGITFFVSYVISLLFLGLSAYLLFVGRLA